MKTTKSTITGVDFTPAKGGVISTTSMKTKRGGTGGGPDYEHKSEQTIHPTLEHAQAHLKAKMGGFFSKQSGDPPKE